MLSEVIHLVLSLLVGLVIGQISGDFFRSITFALISGFFLDLDHLVDYIIIKRGKSFSFKEFSSGRYFKLVGKIRLFAHGYEYIVLFLLLALLFPANSVVFYALAASLFFHLAFDIIHNKCKFSAYSLFYRLVNHFDIRVFGCKHN